jgi:hypothetical protein
VCVGWLVKHRARCAWDARYGHNVSRNHELTCTNFGWLVGWFAGFLVGAISSSLLPRLKPASKYLPLEALSRTLPLIVLVMLVGGMCPACYDPSRR